MKQETYNAQEYRDLIANKDKASGSNFGNVWTEVDGIKFQSIKEAEFYGNLKLRKRAGLIKDFEHGVLYRLVVNRVLICTYRADFVVIEHDDSRTVIDVKSEATEGVYSFKLKCKLMKALYGITVKIVK